jgi:hypothetical protein
MMTLVPVPSEDKVGGTTTSTTVVQTELGTESGNKSPSIATIIHPNRSNHRRDLISPSSRRSSSTSSTQSIFTMNSQYTTTTNDVTSNLHLLSKVIEDNEGDTAMVQRTSTCPKRVSLPSPRTNMESSIDKSLTTCSNKKLVRVAKSWKKRAIIAMEKETPISSYEINHSAMNDNIANVDEIHHNDITTTSATTTNNDDKGKQEQHSEMTMTTTVATMMTPLPLNFRPGPYDVLCGRGRACKDAPGNKAYRTMIMNQLHIYADAPTKLAKGQIISTIMEQIQQQCYTYHGKSKVGGFVKCQHGRWYDVGDFLAREKTSQCFRDALAAQYSSSAQSKYLRRRASKEMDNNDTTSNEHVYDDNDEHHRYHHDTNRSIVESSNRRILEASVVCTSMCSYFFLPFSDDEHFYQQPSFD